MQPSNFTGKKLQAWRENRGWSRSYVAKRIGKSYGWIWRLEVSIEPLPMDVALLIAALDKDVEPMG